MSFRSSEMNDAEVSGRRQIGSKFTVDDYESVQVKQRERLG